MDLYCYDSSDAGALNTKPLLRPFHTRSQTLFSLWTRVLNMKKSFHRTTEGFKAKLSYLAVLTNIILGKNEELGFAKLSMVQWSL